MDEVQAMCLGEPNFITRTRHANGVSEQWIYQSYSGVARAWFLYFVDGKLAVIED